MIAQVNRALAKKDNPLRVGTIFLIDQLIALARLSVDAAVLCVGCRSMTEIDCFKSKGLRNIRGIDLFSEHPQILVMDMHAMDFSDSQFDVVYSSHSLEHSQDVTTVINEFIRVAKPGAAVVIEVPVRFPVTKIDRVDFGNVDALIDAFKPYIGNVLLAEEQPPRTPTNDQGTDIARVIFTVFKENR